MKTSIKVLAITLSIGAALVTGSAVSAHNDASPNPAQLESDDAVPVNGHRFNGVKLNDLGSMRTTLELEGSRLVLPK